MLDVDVFTDLCTISLLTGMVLHSLTPWKHFGVCRSFSFGRLKQRGFELKYGIWIPHDTSKSIVLSSLTQQNGHFLGDHGH